MKRDEKFLKISEIVGDTVCVSSEEGHKVHEEIFRSIEDGRKVVVSFEGVKRLTTAFLNTAIGQLYNEFSDEVINEMVRFADIDTRSAHLVSRVMERAKLYFSDPEKIKRVLNDIIKE